MRWALRAAGWLLVGAAGCTSGSHAGRAVEVTAGAAHACARMEDGAVRCWGAWKSGQRGQGVLLDAGPWKLVAHGSLVPRSLAEDDNLATQVVGLDRVEQLSAGSDHSCARRTSGAVWCWGDNSSSQLGSPKEKREAVPYPVRVDGIPAAVQLASGSRHTCVRAADSTVWCWGAEEAGQLGHEGRAPLAIAGISDAAWLAAGGDTSCAVASSGSIRCWGDNKSGQLGDGAVSEPKKAPTAVQGVRDAVQVAVASTHACALTRSGEVLCWGGNQSGQLGEAAGPAGPARPAAVGIQKLAHATRLLVASGVTCAALPDARTWCVGAGLPGLWELAGGAAAKSVALAPASTGKPAGCAVLENGAIMGWGQLTPRHEGAQPAETSVQVRW